MNGLCMLHLTQFPAQAPAPRAAQANASAQLSSIPWRVRAETLEKWETSHLNQNPQEGLYLETEFVKRQIPEWQLREEEGGLDFGQPAPHSCQAKAALQAPSCDQREEEHREVRIWGD